MKTQSAKANNTKRYILEKTASLFNKKGYHGTSMADIQNATGLTKGSVYGNFEDKDDLALQAFELNYAKIEAFIKAELQQHTHAIDKLMAYIRIYNANSTYIYKIGGCPILNTATDADDLHPRLHAAVNEKIILWQKALTNIIMYGQSRNEIKAEASPENFATLFMALLEGGVLLSKTTGQAYFLNNALAEIEKIIERDLGIGTSNQGIGF